MSERKRVLFIANIPAPYCIDFFNELGQSCELTALFEARRAAGIRFNWKEDEIRTFKAIFLRDGEIRERGVDLRIFSHLPRGRYDVIVATNYGYFTETAALFSLKWRRMPYYLELDGVSERTDENPLVARVKRSLVSAARGVFSSGPAVDAAMLRYGAPPERLIRYPFSSLRESELCAAPPTAEEKRALRALLGLPDGPVVLSVGQFIRRKGFDVLMDAASRLKEKAEIVMIGGEPGADYLSQRARLGLHNVRFLPFMTKEALNRYFRAADLFAFPTREDVWGLVVNEAMAQGLPVVTTTACVSGTVLVAEGKTGFLVPPEAPDALAARIDALLADPALRADMAQRALETARGYTVERMAARHVEVLGLDNGGGAGMTLQTFFTAHPRVAVAFSGGTDSAYLLCAARAAGAEAGAYMLETAFTPAFERRDAARVCALLKLPLTRVPLDVLACSEVRQNGPERCYACKKLLFTALFARARADGFPVLCDGTNATDDAGDRPGMRAIAELGVLSPLRLCGLTKPEIRRLSREAGLPTADKPAYACLATRVPTGAAITAEALARVEGAEDTLFAMGYTDFRARLREGGALLQFTEAELARALAEQNELARRLAPYVGRVEIDFQPRKGQA